MNNDEPFTNHRRVSFDEEVHKQSSEGEIEVINLTEQPLKPVLERPKTPIVLRRFNPYLSPLIIMSHAPQWSHRKYFK